jgi:hypothetical protein
VPRFLRGDAAGWGGRMRIWWSGTAATSDKATAAGDAVLRVPSGVVGFRSEQTLQIQRSDAVV